MDAWLTSIEAQKSKGSLHAHSQLFVQCLHQHTPLADVLRVFRQNRGDLVRKYLVYKAHVCRECYADSPQASARRELREKEWPEYKAHRDLHTLPAMYQNEEALHAEDLVVEGSKWLKTHLVELHVIALKSKG